MNGNFFFSGGLNARRPDVADYFGDKELERSGFFYRFPMELFQDIDVSEVRIFAVSDRGVASELSYPKGYKWGKKL